jgi:integrase
MNLDLFADSDRATTSQYTEAWAGWLAESERTGRLQRESSIDVYEHMWSAFTTWAVGNSVRLSEISALDLATYLESRGGSDDLSKRYALRLMRLVDRVLGHHARARGEPPNSAAADLLASRPDLRFANASDADPLPDYLIASEAKLLVAFLSAVRPGRAEAGQPWQVVRNRASVGLMLGAGLTPGEVRALKTDDVAVDGGRSAGVPWKLRVAGNGNVPARETPVASWAGQLLRYWLEVRSQQSIPGAMVFPSTRSTGKPWGKVAQYNAVKEVLAAARVDDVDGGSFRLRHTFALRQLRRGKSAEEVARWLGVDPGKVMSRYQRVLAAPVDVV